VQLAVRMALWSWDYPGGDGARRYGDGLRHDMTVNSDVMQGFETERRQGTLVDVALLGGGYGIGGARVIAGARDHDVRAFNAVQAVQVRRACSPSSCCAKPMAGGVQSRSFIFSCGRSS